MLLKNTVFYIFIELFLIPDQSVLSEMLTDSSSLSPLEENPALHLSMLEKSEENSAATKGKNKKQNQSEMSAFVTKTSTNLKLKLDQQIARYIYATNTPFLSVEHNEFKTLIEMLRPGYKPPSRYQIGGMLGRCLPRRDCKMC